MTRPRRYWLLLPSLAALSALAALTGCGGGGATTPATGSSNTSGTSSSATSSSATSSTDVLTYHDDAQRTGQDLTETVLTPQNVNSASFGLLRVLPADGLVDGAPLVVSALSIGGSTHNVVYLASENDSVYAYDTDSGALLAQASLLGSGETSSDDRNCGQVVPQIGVTSTPVIDRTAGPNGTLYVMAMSKDAAGNYYQRLHALDLTTLADRLPPQVVQASTPGSGPNSANGMLTFDPKQYKERAALLLLNGQIYLTFASHCDDTPYNGWIIAYNEVTLAQTQVLQITPNGTDGAVWDTGGLAADTSGNVYAAVGNGTFDTTLNSQGMPSQQDYGNAALKISTSGAALTPTDYFTPSDTVTQSANDADFGSGSPLLVDQTDTGGTVHDLLIAGGKDGNMFVLDRDNMGHYSAMDDNVYQVIAVGGPLYSAPAYFGGSVYICDVGGTLKAYAFSDAQLPISPDSQTPETFAYPGTSPSISADGSANPILWAVESGPGSAAVLHAYNPADLGQEYYSSTQAGSRDSFGMGNKFTTPVIANGKVLVGTPDGVAEFGLL